MDPCCLRETWNSLFCIWLTTDQNPNVSGDWNLTFLSCLCVILALLCRRCASSCCGNRRSNLHLFLSFLCIVSFSGSWNTLIRLIAIKLTKGIVVVETQTSQSFSASQTSNELLLWLYDCHKVDWIIWLRSRLWGTLHFQVFLLCFRDLFVLSCNHFAVIAISSKLSLWMDSRIPLSRNS
jgi:hypothetical protein